jgi:hypothetical protein
MNRNANLTEINFSDNIIEPSTDDKLKHPPQLQHLVVADIAHQVKEAMVEKMREIEDEHSLLYVLRVTMECIEVHDVAGFNKKDLAISVTKKLIEESELDDEKKQFCIKLIDSGVIEDTLDLVISATKGELSINKKTTRMVIKQLLKCLSVCK